MGRVPWWLAALAGLFVLFVVWLVVSSLHRPTPRTFSPSPARPVPAGDSVIRGRTVTVDARDPERWRHFDFSRGTVVAEPGARGWDLAVRRFRVVVNGGEGFAGDGGALALGDVPLDSVGEVPDEGFVGTRGTLSGEPEHPELADWYRYDFFSHLLFPREITYAVRTADGGHAALRFLGYYCPGVEAGCVTFRYSYRGDGGREF